jgi:hypothetical protein
MDLRAGARLIVPLVILAVAAVGLMAVSACACVASPPPAGESAWREHLQATDAALAERNPSRAARVWQEARSAALRSGAWNALVEVGDASVRIGELAPARNGAARARARDLYLSALFRARGQRSLDGVLRVTEAFAALGDADVVSQGLRIAGRLAASQGPAAQDRVREAASRLGARHLMAGGIDSRLF